MDSHAVVIDLSSDEEDGSWRNNSMSAGLGENDDVIIVHEIPAPSAKSRRPGSGCLGPGKDRGSEDDDDECVELEADPDKPVLLSDHQCDGEDELLIVAEKGELACRDYPHSRHLCATFPFSSSPHEKYCNLCHCYVCDTQAPCSYWGNGNSCSDHCHSTDKEERWKVLRQSSKQKKSGAIQTQGLTAINPHSRHLCVTFPFSSSPHEKYCNLCRCYACNSRAPCRYWGNGISKYDHCHSNDKEERWKALRQSITKNMGGKQTQELTDSSSFDIPLIRDATSSCHFDPNLVLAPCSRSNSLWSYSATGISNTSTINKRKRYQPTILSCHYKRFGRQTIKSYPLNPSVEHVPKRSTVDSTSTTRLMYSRTRNKRPHTTEAGFSRPNNLSCNNHSSNSRFPNDVPITSNRPRFSEVGKQTSQDMLHASQGHSVDQMQATFLSRSTQSMMKDSMCPLVTAADINQQSWHDILASVAPELRVPLSSDNSNVRNAQPLIVSSPSSVPVDKSLSGIGPDQV